MKKVRNKISPTLNIHLFSDITPWKVSNMIASYVSFFEGCSSCSWPLKQRCFSKFISLDALFFFPFTTFLYVCDFIYSQHLARIFQSRLNIFFLACPFSQLLLGISTLGECWFLKPHIQRTEWSPWHWLSNFYSYHAFFKHLTIIFGSSLTNPGHAGSHRLYLLGLHDILSLFIALSIPALLHTGPHYLSLGQEVRQVWWSIKKMGSHSILASWHPRHSNT